MWYSLYSHCVYRPESCKVRATEKFPTYHLHICLYNGQDFTSLQSETNWKKHLYGHVNRAMALDIPYRFLNIHILDARQHIF